MLKGDDGLVQGKKNTEKWNKERAKTPLGNQKTVQVTADHDHVARLHGGEPAETNSGLNRAEWAQAYCYQSFCDLTHRAFD